MKDLLSKLLSPGLYFWFSTFWLTFDAILYLFQPDWAFALTLYSPWAPGLLGFFLTVFPAIAKRSKPLFFLSLAWVAWGGYSSEEFHTLLARGPDETELNSFRYDGKRVRIISLNCAGGSFQAAREVKAWSPDLVLLQESPGVKELAPLAKELFGPRAGLLVGPDCAILSKHPIRPLLPSKGNRGPSNFVLGQVLGPGAPWLVASVRLQPPVLRFDYWNLDCWRAYAEGKRGRREELREVMTAIHEFDDKEPMIVGGDFNAPPDRSIRDVMAERGGLPNFPLIDTAREAGSGWTLTAVNGIPLVRIDQVWVDPRFQPLRTIARLTSYSDHRMVVADVMMRP